MMSLIGNTCPHCNASVPGELRAWHFYTCDACHKPFIHTEEDPKWPLTEYRETVSPVSIGSRGKAGSDQFEITGCITLYQNNSLVNLFCVLWSTGLYGYLIETEGRIAITEFIDVNPPKELRKSNLGKNIFIEKYGSLHCFSVSKTEGIALSGSGKIYFPELRNSLFCSVFDKNEKALYVIYGKSSTYLLQGAFYTLEDLGLSNNRYLPAWHTHRRFPAPLTLACPECSKTLRSYSHFRAKHFTCESCGTVSAFNAEGLLKSIKKIGATKNATFKIGTVFVLEDAEFVLINYCIKREHGYNTDWMEYTLFNPEKGCWYLNESEGHYNLVKPWRSYISEEDKRFRSVPKDGLNYQLYSKYKYKITHAAGEFLTNALTFSQPHCVDYVSPPYLLAVESNGEEVNWFEGVYCDHAKVKSWLTESIDLKPKEGIAPNEPFSLNFEQQSFTRLTVLSVTLLIFIQILLSGLVTTSDNVYAKSFGQVDSLNTRTIVSDAFDISKNNCAVDFILHSDINNTWLEADFTLVNETTGDQYYFSKAIEYYSGYDDEGRWSEGSKDETVTVNAVKKGKYHLNILLTTDGAKSYHQIDVTVIENVVLLKNFFIALACLIIFPLLVFYRRRTFDRKQWYNSNYSPYTYDD